MAAYSNVPHGDVSSSDVEDPSPVQDGTPGRKRRRKAFSRWRHEIACFFIGFGVVFLVLGSTSRFFKESTGSTKVGVVQSDGAMSLSKRDVTCENCTHFASEDWRRPTKTNPLLDLPSTAPVNTFYMYRVQSVADYPLENVNTATIGGVLWYLQNEVIFTCNYGKWGARKFGITRIMRYKVSTKATAPMWEKGLNFGVKCSMDSGECTGPHQRTNTDGKGTGPLSAAQWNQFGYFVGCSRLGEWPHSEFQSAKRYPNAVWYSLPGECPTRDIQHKTSTCLTREKGGHCAYPTGTGDCTYSYEPAGEIDLDELVGITPKWKNRADFCSHCHREDGGCGLSFWHNIWDQKKNQERVNKAIELFDKKYPDMPSETQMSAPPCDFDRKHFGGNYGTGR